MKAEQNSQQKDIYLHIVVNNGPIVLNNTEYRQRQIRQYETARIIIGYRIEQSIFDAIKAVIEQRAEKYPEQLTEKHNDILAMIDEYKDRKSI